jgi:ankyrin repeat protein
LWLEYSTNQIISWNIIWAKFDLTADELNKFLLATDNDGKTVFHVAAKFSEMELNKLLLDTNNEGKTVHL